ncbi:MAG: porin family protein [Thiohalomonadales bacterium]
MHPILVFFSVLLAIVQMSDALAEGNPRFYIEGNLAQTQVKVPSSKYKLYMAGIKVGYHVQQYVAVEAQYATTISDDDANNLTVDVGSLSGFYLRVGSSNKKDMRTYLLFGQSYATVNYTSTRGSFSDKVEDFAWGIGAEERLKRWPLVFLNAEYLQQFENNGEKITTISLGLRYEF